MPHINFIPESLLVLVDVYIFNSVTLIWKLTRDQRKLILSSLWIQKYLCCLLYNNLKKQKKILYLKKVFFPLGVPFERLVWLNVLIYNLISNHFFVNKYINTSNLIVWHECICNIRVVLFCELFVLSFVFLLLPAYTFF